MMNLWIGPGNDPVFVGSIRFKNKWLKFYIVIIALTLVTIPCAICYLLTIFIKSTSLLCIKFPLPLTESHHYRIAVCPKGILQKYLDRNFHYCALLL